MSDNITALLQNQRWQNGKVHRLWIVCARYDEHFFPLIDIHGVAKAYRRLADAKHEAAQERRMRGAGHVCVKEVTTG